MRKRIGLLLLLFLLLPLLLFLPNWPFTGQTVSEDTILSSLENESTTAGATGESSVKEESPSEEETSETGETVSSQESNKSSLNGGSSSGSSSSGSSSGGSSSGGVSSNSEESSTPPISNQSNESSDGVQVEIVVSLFTHVEEPGGSYPNFLENEDAFWEHRAAAIGFATYLRGNGLPYHYQSDWNFLAAALAYDNGTETSNNKNFLRYLAEDLGVHIDPHAHESSYSYADVAYLIDKLGVEPSGVVGGFLAYPPEKSKLERLQGGSIEGWQYNYTWEPKILIGGGTIDHEDDERISASGIWSPQDNENFFIHNTSGPLPLIGMLRVSEDKNDSIHSGGLLQLLDDYEEGLLTPGVMYTATISVDQIHFAENGTEVQEELTLLMEDMQPYIDADIIRWASFEEAITIWETEYGSEPNIYRSLYAN